MSLNTPHEASSGPIPAWADTLHLLALWGLCFASHSRSPEAERRSWKRPLFRSAHHGTCTPVPDTRCVCITTSAQHRHSYTSRHADWGHGVHTDHYVHFSCNFWMILGCYSRHTSLIPILWKVDHIWAADNWGFQSRTRIIRDQSTHSVPAHCWVMMTLCASSMGRANPKSAILGWRFLSSRMLLALMSRWMIRDWDEACR